MQIRSRPSIYRQSFALLVLSVVAGGAGARNSAFQSTISPTSIEYIRINEDDTRFVFADSRNTFTPSGFNYVADASGRSLDDCWGRERPETSGNRG